jgi:hypothetical protein
MSITSGREFTRRGGEKEARKETEMPALLLFLLSLIPSLFSRSSR